MALLEPRDHELELEDGTKKTYILSKFPCIPGREIVTKYISSAIPKIGDYSVNEEMMFKMMAYIGVKHPNGDIILLSTPELINSHIKSWEDSLALESAMMEYNCRFFRGGQIWTFLQDFAPEYPSVGFPNVDGFIAAIVTERQYTIVELKTIVTLEDAFDTWEIIVTTRYNEYLAHEHAKKKAETKQR